MQPIRNTQLSLPDRQVLRDVLYYSTVEPEACEDMRKNKNFLLRPNINRYQQRIRRLNATSSTTIVESLTSENDVDQRRFAAERVFLLLMGFVPNWVKACVPLVQSVHEVGRKEKSVFPFIQSECVSVIEGPGMSASSTSQRSQIFQRAFHWLNLDQQLRRRSSFSTKNDGCHYPLV